MPHNSIVIEKKDFEKQKTNNNNNKSGHVYSQHMAYGKMIFCRFVCGASNILIVSCASNIAAAYNVLFSIGVWLPLLLRYVPLRLLLHSLLKYIHTYTHIYVFALLSK